MREQYPQPAGNKAAAKHSNVNEGSSMREHDHPSSLQQPKLSKQINTRDMQQRHRTSTLDQLIS